MPGKSLRSAVLGFLISVLICEFSLADIVEPSCPPGYLFINCRCESVSSCPTSYNLNQDGNCYAKCQTGQYLHKNGNCYTQENIKCPDEYFLNVNGLCHPTHPEPCPFASTTTTSTTTEPTTTTTKTEPTQKILQR